MWLYDFKSPNDVRTLGDCLGASFKKENPFESGQWIYYVNEVRQDSLNKKIRARSKIVAVEMSAPQANLRFAYESPFLVVLNKASGVPTQKTLKQNQDNLYDQVRRFYILKQNGPKNLPYVGLHHRLDRDTSGLVLMTKKSSANKAVSDLFKNKKIKKTYLAFTEFGEIQPTNIWEVRNLISRGPSKRGRFYFQVSSKGDEAITRFRLLESQDQQWHKIECEPLTGRTHQLRVHLSHQGWPILGDRTYAKDFKSHNVDRLMLHACRLEFDFQGQGVVVEAMPDWGL